MISDLLIYFTVPNAWVAISVILYKRNKKKGFYTLLTFALFFLYVRYTSHVWDYYAPGARDFTLEQLTSNKIKNFESFIINNGTADFYLVIPKLPIYETLLRITACVATPPRYIVDSKGFIVDWSSNLDDDQEFYKEWNLSKMKQIDSNEIKNKFDITE